MGQWLLGFAGIMFIRFFLEALSNPTTSGVIASDPYTLVHYLLFFITVMMGTACIVGFFSKDFLSAGKLILFALPLSWLAPILDIVISLGKGYRMSYVFDSHQTLLVDFFKFFSFQPMQWATYGMRVEIIIILLGIGWYVWLKRKTVLPIILAVFSTYFLIFLIGSVPGLLYTFTHINNGVDSNSLSVFGYINNLLIDSNILHNTLHETTFSVTPLRFFELGFNKLMSQILFILSFVFVSILFWKIETKKFKAVVKNARLGRIFFYLSLLFLGMGGAYTLGFKLTSWVDILGVVCLVISWVGLWLYAVQINDIADIDIDKISNKERPLVQGVMTTSDMKEVGLIWLVIALSGSWSAGFYPFYMCIVGLFVSHIYSAEPFCLKRIPVLSTFLISIASLVTILAGFFFVSWDKTFQTFPLLLALGTLVVFTLEINIKDMKDIEGDKANGIKTLPVIFGKNGPRVVGLCFALSILSVPLFLSFYILYIISIPVAIISYRLITRTPYREKPIFILHFIYLLLIVLLFMVSPWLVNFL